METRDGGNIRWTTQGSNELSIGPIILRCLLKSAPGHYMQYCRDDYLIVNKAALSSR